MTVTAKLLTAAEQISSIKSLQGAPVLMKQSSMPNLTYRELFELSVAQGISLLVALLITALFNPTISLALCFCGVIKPTRAVILSTAQFVAAIAGAALVAGLTASSGVDSVVARSHEAIGLAQAVFIESTLTTIFVLAVLFQTAEPVSSHRTATSVALAYTGCLLPAIYWTATSLNPARTLATALISNDWPIETWTYILGDVIGVIVACVLRRALVAVSPYTSLLLVERVPAEQISKTRAQMRSTRLTHLQRTALLAAGTTVDLLDQAERALTEATLSSPLHDEARDSTGATRESAPSPPITGAPTEQVKLLPAPDIDMQQPISSPARQGLTEVMPTDVERDRLSIELRSDVLSTISEKTAEQV
ncbi:uncharacterized protein L969DRAFT_91791 [Mixia osmundae IAM 14324]|uniref:Aquaporin n=1 Tax=Mixia osmundae (strain CBS 9802 / IAM 14324 / JCM 22182 / KY 12970) TaxID=764103 RepID=G7EAJ0_MIXOS|nr:uncharacterized protein L969DRAFT_91791 [Mixia osmundae IAM 14324]KEI42340.1 hypothetical protein L969DRAFT_91791 [Mixia osmundae IAM 14324]GAA99850.1 hypothetical protein E5Q_06553 [Mixia osmundae IAM 14324]